MLMPKKVKFRKQQRGRRAGMAKGGDTIAFGDYGLQALECGWITARQIEAARTASRVDGAPRAGAQPRVYTAPPPHQARCKVLDPGVSEQAGHQEAPGNP